MHLGRTVSFTWTRKVVGSNFRMLFLRGILIACQTLGSFVKPKADSVFAAHSNHEYIGQDMLHSHYSWEKAATTMTSKPGVIETYIIPQWDRYGNRQGKSGLLATGKEISKPGELASRTLAVSNAWATRPRTISCVQCERDKNPVCSRWICLKFILSDLSSLPAWYSSEMGSRLLRLKGGTIK